MTASSYRAAASGDRRVARLARPPGEPEPMIRAGGPRFWAATAGACLLLGGASLAWVRYRPGALRPGVIADRIVVEKQARRLTLYRGGAPLKSYRVALGQHPIGAKRAEGDKRTPEGEYMIDWRKADSEYHRALHISYPDKSDSARARERGESPGGSIMIHGLPNGLGWIGSAHQATDWTDGCIAVTNPEIEEIWAAVPDGTPIEIRP